MEMYIHYKSLPQGKDLHDVIGELNEVLEDVGNTASPEKKILRCAITAMSHIIYLGHCFEVMAADMK